MLWPNEIDYTEAIGFSPDISILDPTLENGNAQREAYDYGNGIVKNLTRPGCL